MKAVQNRVIIRKEAHENKQGMIITLNDAGKTCIGMVVAVGPGKLNEQGIRQPLDVSINDRVVYNRHGGQPITLGGEEFLVLFDHDIFGVLEDVGQ